ncbi:MAG: hypothetical protein JW940_00640 [Polyangiaceae bacterium]|nr:hypothetical protein [Polyangiaceae bacterium]
MLDLLRPSRAAHLGVAALCLCATWAVGSAPAQTQAPSVSTEQTPSSDDCLAPSPPESHTNPSEPEDPLSAPPCDGLRVSIIIEAEDPTTSRATLSGPGAEGTRTARVGTRVSGATVVFIGTNPRSASPAVWLTSGRGLCQSSMFAPGMSTRQFGSEAQPVDGGRPSTPQRLSRLRVFPELRDGKVIGVRVTGITPGSLPALLGLSNGDRLERVNGYELSNMENALMLYSRLRRMDRLEVELERRGQKITNTYFIR